jgi:predicted nucleotidyltransferase
VSQPELQSTLSAALVEEPAVELALLFGSRARGTAGPRSDVDVAILGAPGLDRLGLAASLGTRLGLEVDVLTLDDVPIPLLDALVREAIVIHEAHPGAAARWRSRALSQLETDRPWFARMRDAWLARVAARGL